VGLCPEPGGISFRFTKAVRIACSARQLNAQHIEIRGLGAEAGLALLVLIHAFYTVELRDTDDSLVIDKLYRRSLVTRWPRSITGPQVLNSP
jgi:hypothetical protein